MSSPSTAIKVNYLAMKCLHFESLRGDLQEGHGYGKRLGGYDKLLHDYASRCQSLSSRWQFLSSQCQFLPSRSPLSSSRAQNWGFCALLPFRTLDFRLFEHKIAIFVRFWGLQPLFSSFSSTKSRFLCSGRRGLAVGREVIGTWKRNRCLPANHRAHFQNAKAS